MADYSAQASLPRGLRDNNPGDLQQPPGQQWQGTVGMDGPFVVFADTTWGLRALARDLITKISVDGLDTIATLINQYAPPSENDTADYISSVAADSGIGAGDQLGTDQDTITSLMRAIVNHEIGDADSQNYVPDADILKGYQMANDPTTVFSAAVVAAKANPGTAIAIGVGVALLLLWVFRNEED
jgi:hypothetical protein